MKGWKKWEGEKEKPDILREDEESEGEEETKTKTGGKDKDKVKDRGKDKDKGDLPGEDEKGEREGEKESCLVENSPPLHSSWSCLANPLLFLLFYSLIHFFFRQSLFFLLVFTQFIETCWPFTSCQDCFTLLNQTTPTYFNFLL